MWQTYISTMDTVVLVGLGSLLLSFGLSFIQCAWNIIQHKNVEAACSSK